MASATAATAAEMEAPWNGLVMATTIMSAAGGEVAAVTLYTSAWILCGSGTRTTIPTSRCWQSDGKSERVSFVVFLTTMLRCCLVVWRSQRKAARGQGLNFVEAIFSVVFGDGNPNDDFEDARYQRLAQLIRDNGYALTAEQLAPFLDLPAQDEEDIVTRDESFVLPVLQQFRGVPEVTEDGDLVYLFPDLSSTADAGQAAQSLKSSTGQRKYQLDVSDFESELQESVRGGSIGKAFKSMVGAKAATFMQEKEYKFTAAGPGQIVATTLLGLVNSVGMKV